MVNYLFDKIRITYLMNIGYEVLEPRNQLGTNIEWLLCVIKDNLSGLYVICKEFLRLNSI